MYGLLSHIRILLFFFFQWYEKSLGDLDQKCDVIFISEKDYSGYYTKDHLWKLESSHASGFDQTGDRGLIRSEEILNILKLK